MPAKTNTPGGLQQASGWSTPDGKLWVYGGYGSDSKGFLSYSDDLWSYSISSGNWTWLKGSGTKHSSSPSAVYGTQGVADPANTPGARRRSQTWTDLQGRLWLFSGDLAPNDMWEYDPATNEWTWVTGSSDPTCYNYLGCPSKGVYGTRGVSAAANTPGTRTGAVTWTASDGTLWMQGGLGADSVGQSYSGGAQTYLNDLWQFDPNTRQWTWVDGESLQPCQDIPSYGKYCWTNATFGTLGKPDPSVNPGGRTQFAGWQDRAGNVWIFGGDYFYGSGKSGILLDANADHIFRFHSTTSYSSITPAPGFSVPAGTYASPQTVTLSDPASGAAIYYTTDGTTPTVSSNLYTAPIQLSQNVILKSIAVANGQAPSPVTQAAYIFQWSFSLATPAGTPSGVNISAGGSGSLSIAAIPILNSTFPAAVTFSVTGLPQGATALFQPSSIAAGSSRSLVTLTVQTTAAKASLYSASQLPTILCFAGIPVWVLKRRRKALHSQPLNRLLPAAAFLVLVIGGVSACGGGGAGSPSGPSGGSGGAATPPGTYPLHVTAICGQQQATFTVNVQVL